MSSLTRSLLTLLNSPASHRFFTANTTTAKSSLRRLQPATFIFTPSIHSSPNFPKFSTSATKTTNPNPNPNPTKMDLNYPSNEDFVHIENPSDSTNNPLTESIVDVANELREEGKEDQYQNQNQNQNQKEAVSASEVPNQRKELPEELSRSVMVLTCESKADGGSTCDVYLVGTAHVSQESCKLVQAVISYLKPQVVFLELCANRVAVLTPQNLKIPTMGEMVGMWKKSHNTFGILYSWFLAKVANQLEVFPGSEFRVAFEEARKYEGSVILGDRPVQITLQRTWAKMPLWHKVKLLYSLLFQALFLPSSEDLNKMLKEMDDVDMLTLVIQEMSKQFPTLMETLVHERDQYMSSTLLRVAREHTSVVAVVGKGHLQGIKKYWEQPIVMKDLMEIPSDKPAVSALKILASVGAAVAGVAVISCIFLSRKK